MNMGVSWIGRLPGPAPMAQCAAAQGCDDYNLFTEGRSKKFASAGRAVAWNAAHMPLERRTCASS
jgi:hypothetical protein